MGLPPGTPGTRLPSLFGGHVGIYPNLSVVLSLIQVFEFSEADGSESHAARWAEIAGPMMNMDPATEVG